MSRFLTVSMNFPFKAVQEQSEVERDKQLWPLTYFTEGVWSGMQLLKN